ncbi:MAG: alpha/beta fold hydrolase [Candidatus Sungbacteria bacterium]|nr:alpha/beta fold hydrolase [Candidatus Sungbacteria bacterium]
MIPVFLSRIKTRDGVTLDGLVVRPERKTKTALIWLHGLSSRFSSGQTLVKELSQKCRRDGIGYFKFNNRGHDIVNRDGRGKKRLQGAAFEKFENCVLDIRAVINFAKKLGYKKIILAGHSTGANKALYYLYKTRDRSVRGLILLGPVSDIAYDYMKFGKETVRRRVALAKNRKPFSLLPQEFGIWTAQRFLSILGEGRPEDVFPYHNSRARWKELKSVRVPLLVVIGSKDEYLDRPAEKLLKAFEQQNAISSKSFSGVIIKNASHGFYKKEGELAKEIINWIKRI